MQRLAEREQLQHSLLCIRQPRHPRGDQLAE
jgi:hypothetical protein